MPGDKKSEPKIPAVEIFSLVLEDALVEVVYNAAQRPALRFCVYHNGGFQYLKHLWRVNGKIDWSCTLPHNPETTEELVPPNSLLLAIEKGQILLPSKPKEYGDEQMLDADIEVFLYRYNDVPEFQSELATKYARMTWVFDRFASVPYLQELGEPGTGKTRLIETVGSICYKAIRASGGMTQSPLFRLVALVGGTMFIDEAAPMNTSMRSDLAAILNCGYSRNGCVWRSELNEGKNWTPRSSSVFGPKIFASRIPFADTATGERCFTSQHHRKSVRQDIPRQLPQTFEAEALLLRNQLLMWRMRNFPLIQVDETPLIHLQPSRLVEIALPIYAIAGVGFRKRFLQYLTGESSERTSSGPHSVIVAALVGLYGAGVREWQTLLPGDVLKWIAEHAADFGVDPEEFTAHRIGDILRTLGFEQQNRTNRGRPYKITKETLDRLASEMGIELHVKSEAGD